MSLQICQWQGDGTKANGFRPAGIDGIGVDWCLWDIRPDPTQISGFCLVECAASVPGALRTIGDAPGDTLTPAARNFLNNRLGTNHTDTNLVDFLQQMALRPPTGKWLPVRAPDGPGSFELWIGQRWFSIPNIAGGTALATDNFNRADANPISGNWTTFSGETAFQITTNTARPSNSLSDAGSYESSATWPNDQYSQAKATAPTSFNDGSGIGVRVRMSTSARTAYDSIVDSSGHAFHDKFVAGTFTQIWTRAITYSAGAVIYLEVQGTTLVTKYNGAAVGASNTDSSIASGKAGLRHSSNTNSNTLLDDWEGGDFGGGGGSPTPRPLAVLGVGT